MNIIKQMDSYSVYNKVGCLIGVDTGMEGCFCCFYYCHIENFGTYLVLTYAIQLFKWIVLYYVVDSKVGWRVLMLRPLTH